MSVIVRARLLSSMLKRNNNLCFSSTTVNTPKEHIVSSSSTVVNEHVADQVPPPHSSPGKSGFAMRLLKYGLIASVTGALATTGYVTYAYTTDEIDEKTKAFRASANVALQDDGSTLGVKHVDCYTIRPEELESFESEFKFVLRPQDETLQDFDLNATPTLSLLGGSCIEIKILYCFICLVPEGLENEEKFQAIIQSAAVTVPAKLLEVYIDGRRSIEEHVRGFTEPSSDKLLPDLHPMEQNAFTLVLDLNETLIYSDWKRDRGWRTFKRPGVDAFLEHLAKFYEIVVYSDQLNMYVDPSVERLDPNHYIRFKLSRSATKYQNQKHYRDLSMLNRDPSRILYLSGNALETSLQPENCVPIKPWKGEPDDTALLDIIPFLEYVATHRPADIRPVLASYKGHDIAKEFIERSKEVQKKMQGQKQQGRLWRR